METCIFCQIAEHKMPARVVYENERIIAFSDINPKAPIHVLIIPKKHIKSLNEAEEEDKTILGELLFAASLVAEAVGIKKKGYRLIVNTGHDGGQLVEHLHFHLLGGKNLGPKIIVE